MVVSTVAVATGVSQAAGPSPYANAVAADGPIAYWRLGETAGTSAADASGNGRAGTYAGGVAPGQPGALAGDTDAAASFNGSTANVIVADAPALRLNGAFTIELWAKLTAFANTWPGLVVKGASSTAAGYLVWYDSAGAVHFKRNNVEVASPAGALTGTRYSHLVLVSTGTQVIWYVDGVAVRTVALTYPTNTGTAALDIGRGDQFGRQSIDEVALYAKALTATQVANHQRTGTTTNPPPTTDPVLVVAGDIACASTDPNSLGTNPATCQGRATRSLITASAPATLAPLGDLIYGDPSLTGVQQSYGAVWGNLGAGITVHPVVGNHDYGGEHELLTAGATAPGYYAYFGSAANPTGQTTATGQPVGWYSYDLGTWHVIVLNHECATVGGCGAGSPQDTWLAADLAAHPAACTVVLGHEPRWSDVADLTEYQNVWQRITAAHAALLISGHHHNYQRFAPRDVNGAASAEGTRQFVVGTGGASLGGFPSGSTTTQFRDAAHYGVLKLTLRAGSYGWQFVTTSGAVADSGTTSCPTSTPPPPPPPPGSRYATAVLASSPAAYWRLGDTAGSATAAEASGRSTVGTYVGGVTRGVAGPLVGDADTAATFDGTSGAVTVPDTPPLRLNGAFTIELWVRLDRFANTWPGLLVKGDASTADGYLMYYTSAGEVRLKRNNREFASGAGALVAGAWQHLAVTFDGTGAVRWYVNGVLTTTTTATFPASIGPGALTIGRADQFGAQSMDEVALYPTALDTTTLAAHVAAGR